MAARGGLYGGWGWDGPYVSDETRIAVDLFDAKSHTPIWHASVSQSVGDLTGPNAEAKIGAGTAAIFAKFPIAAPAPAGGQARLSPSEPGADKPVSPAAAGP